MFLLLLHPCIVLSVRDFFAFILLNILYKISDKQDQNIFAAIVGFFFKVLKKSVIFQDNVIFSPIIKIMVVFPSTKVIFTNWQIVVILPIILSSVAGKSYSNEVS